MQAALDGLRHAVLRRPRSPRLAAAAAERRPRLAGARFGRRRTALLEVLEHAVGEVTAVIIRDLGVADRLDDPVKLGFEARAPFGRREILAFDLVRP